MTLIVKAAGKTDVGVVRTNNEDNFGYDIRNGIFVVCDGMGGQAAGELASEIGVETLLRYFSDEAGADGAQIVSATFEGVSARATGLANGILLANRAIREAAALDSQRTGMGSTIVAVRVEGNLFSIANVGDSRIYLIRGGSIQQLTNDHSLVMEQVRRGLMAPEEAAQSRMQNIIIRALGTEESVEPDLADHEFATGDLLLLCTDGLTKAVKDAVIGEILAQSDDLEGACEELIEAAKASGSDDNITCLLLRAAEQSWHERLLERLTPGKNSSVKDGSV